MLTPTFLGDLLICAVLGLMGWHTWLLFRQRRWTLFDPLNTFWAGILVIYVGQPMLAGDILISWHNEAVFHKTLFATLWGLCAVVIGYEITNGASLAKRLPVLPSRLSSSRLLVCALVLLTLGVVGYAYVIGQSGGWAVWISVGRGGTDFEKVQGYLPELTQGIPAGVLLLFYRAQIRRVSFFSVIIAWIGAGALLWWFLYLGSRSRLIMAGILILAAYYLPRQRLPRWWFLAVCFIGMVCLTNLQNFRQNFTNLSFNLDQIDRKELWGTVLPAPLGGDRELKRQQFTPGAEFNCAMCVVKLVPDSVAYNYGYGFLELFTRPIPRAVWPRKIYPHIESVQGVLREAGLSQATVSTVNDRELLMGPAFAFVGHWYYVAGFAGLLIGGLVTGALFRFIRGILDNGRGNESVQLLYPLLLGIGFGEAASTPWYWFYGLPFVLLPFLAAFYFSRERIVVRPVRFCGRRRTRAKAEEVLPRA